RRRSRHQRRPRRVSERLSPRRPGYTTRAPVTQNGPVRSTSSWFANRRDPTWIAPRPDPSATVFHRRLPDYAVTPLVELPVIARELGVGRVFAKDESRRFGLPAFKALGA